MSASSPPFVRIRSPGPASSPEASVYELALELAGAVHEAIELGGARYHLRDRLDRCTTSIALELARAATEVRQGRWRHYRAAHRGGNDCATLLDVLAHQRPAPSEPLARARALARRLLEALEPLAQLDSAARLG